MSGAAPVGGQGGRSRRPQMGLAGLGMELLAAVVGATLIGLWIDRRFDCAPWGVLIGAIVGIVGGLLNFIRAANRAVKRDQRP